MAARGHPSSLWSETQLPLGPSGCLVTAIAGMTRDPPAGVSTAGASGPRVWVTKHRSGGPAGPAGAVLSPRGPWGPASRHEVHLATFSAYSQKLCRSV